MSSYNHHHILIGKLRKQVS